MRVMINQNQRWIQGAVKHPGALHKALGVKQGEKIPAKKLAKAAKKKNISTKMKQRLVFAKNMRKIAARRKQI